MPPAALTQTAQTTTPTGTAPAILNSTNGPAVVGSNAPNDGRSLWQQAYEKQKAEHPKLISTYEALIDSATGSTPNQDSESMSKLIEAKLQEVEQRQWKVQIGGTSVKVREVVSKLVRAVIFAKEFITPAINTDPHAGLAWAGVCMLLPLICRPEEQDKALLDGLEVICDVLCRFTVTEGVFFRQKTARVLSSSTIDDVTKLCTRFQERSVSMLSCIIEYQARTACQCTRNTAVRYFRDVMKSDDWKELLATIKQCDEACTSMARTLKAQRYDGQIKELFTRLETLSAATDKLLAVEHQTLDAVQTGFKSEKTRREAELERQCLDAFWTTKYEKHKAAVPLRVPGTCQWFTQHDRYIAWKATTGVDLLWLTADPGCGKSVISRYLVEEELAASSDQVTCYFFFKSDNNEQVSLENALCAILHQIFVQRSELIRHAVGHYSSKGAALTGDTRALWQILLAISLDDRTKQVVCILDALDECTSADCYLLISQVTQLYKDAMSKTSPPKAANIKFLLTSRPYYDINRKFHDIVLQAPNVKLSADLETTAIKKEIDRVIDYRIAEIRQSLAFSENVSQSVAQRLKAKDNRTYLWLRLILETIETSLEGSEKKLLRLLESVPANVFEAYADILSRSVNLEKASEIFKIMLAAQRPLTVLEMNVALALDSETYREDELPLEPERVFQDKVRHICGLLVTIIDDRILFIHQTAREFLLSSAPRNAKTTSHVSFDATDAHETLARVSAWYLMFEARALRPPCGGSFFVYCANYWDTHTRQCVSDPRRACRLLESTLGIARCIRSWWRVRSKPEPNVFYVTPTSWNETYVLAYFGCAQALDSCLKDAVAAGLTSSEADTKVRDRKGRTALSWVCTGGVNQLQTARVLLDHGADPFAEDREGKSPFAYAVYWERSDLATLFLARCSELDALRESVRLMSVVVSGVFGYSDRVPTFLRNYFAQHKPSRAGYSIVYPSVHGSRHVLVCLISMLVDFMSEQPEVQFQFEAFHLEQVVAHGAASVAMQIVDLGLNLDEDNASRLLLSLLRSESGNTAHGSGVMFRDCRRLISMLMSKGATIADPGKVLTPALVEAARNGDDEMLTLLLENGADIHAVDRVGRDALSYAAATGSAACIQILLAYGADLDRIDLRGRIPLAYAIMNPHDAGREAVQALLSAEPDIDQLIARLRSMTAHTHAPSEGDCSVESLYGMQLWRVYEDGTRKALGMTRRID